jgi:hypothetical protein
MLAQHILANLTAVRFDGSSSPATPRMAIRSNMFQFQQAPPLTVVPLRKDGIGLPAFDGDNDRPLKLDDEDTLRDRWRAGPVDHLKSCMFSYGCIMRHLSKSTLCSFHHRIMVYFARWFLAPRRATRDQVAVGYDADVEFIRPNDIDIISSIHQLNTKFKLWTTDCQFGVVKGPYAIV